jgi:hypothetical protein
MIAMDLKSIWEMSAQVDPQRKSTGHRLAAEKILFP